MVKDKKTERSPIHVTNAARTFNTEVGRASNKHPKSVSISPENTSHNRINPRLSFRTFNNRLTHGFALFRHVVSNKDGLVFIVHDDAIGGYEARAEYYNITIKADSLDDLKSKIMAEAKNLLINTKRSLKYVIITYIGIPL